MSENYRQPAALTALEAKSEAQKLAFSAIAFEAVVSLLRLGILRAVSDAGNDGTRANDIAGKLGLSEYGVKVVLDMGLSANLVWLNDDRYVLDKVGHFLLEDRMTRVNVNFAQDVCYEAMGHLQESIKSGKPEGLKVFGDWPTIYPGLTHMPEPARTSWSEFNCYYSRQAFPDALPIVFATSPRRLLDIGGNSGTWALQCVAHDPDVHVTIVDLPGQTSIARENARENGAEDRIDTVDMNLLEPEQQLPVGADTIWMSQFLDCFPESQIRTILDRCAEIMNEDSSMFILETFWNRQEFDAAAYSINATSLYFTCLANGTSRMYHSEDFIGIAKAAGFGVVAQHDNLGVGHTLLHLKK
jgi:hypothetical protein